MHIDLIILRAQKYSTPCMILILTSTPTTRLLIWDPYVQDQVAVDPIINPKATLNPKLPKPEPHVGSFELANEALHLRRLPPPRCKDNKSATHLQGLE